MTYREVAEAADRTIASPYFMAVFLSVVGLAWISVDVSNFIISVITGGGVILNTGAQRRQAAATQSKLDELIAALPDARDDLKHAEDREEHEIDQLRC